MPSLYCQPEASLLLDQRHCVALDKSLAILGLSSLSCKGLSGTLAQILETSPSKS